MGIRFRIATYIYIGKFNLLFSFRIQWSELWFKVKWVVFDCGLTGGSRTLWRVSVATWTSICSSGASSSVSCSPNTRRCGRPSWNASRLWKEATNPSRASSTAPARWPMATNSSWTTWTPTRGTTTNPIKTKTRYFYLKKKQTWKQQLRNIVFSFDVQNSLLGLLGGLDSFDGGLPASKPSAPVAGSSSQDLLDLLGGLDLSAAPSMPAPGVPPARPSLVNNNLANLLGSPVSPMSSMPSMTAPPVSSNSSFLIDNFLAPVPAAPSNLTPL